MQSTLEDLSQTNAGNTPTTSVGHSTTAAPGDVSKSIVRIIFNFLRMDCHKYQYSLINFNPLTVTLFLEHGMG